MAGVKIFIEKIINYGIIVKKKIAHGEKEGCYVCIRV